VKPTVQTHITQLSRIERNLNEERYSEAIQLLDSLRSSHCRFDSVREIVHFLHLYAQALHNTGKDVKALVKAKAALRIARNLHDDKLYADLKLTQGRILVRLGRLRDAAERFTESYVFFSRAGDHISMLYPLDALGHVHHIQGHLARAQEVFDQALTLALKLSLGKKANTLRRNLVVVSVSMGELRNSLSILDSMESGGLENWEKANIERLRGMIALLRLDYSEAERLLDKALQYFRRSGSRRDINVCKEFLGLLQSYSGKQGEARSVFREILKDTEATASVVAQTLRMLTDVYIAEGKWRKATTTAKKAEEAITKINERKELGALYRAYGQIYTHENKTETARDYFRKSIDLLREIGARYELALSYFAAGQSESYDPNERMSHLHTARTLFVEMDVPKRVEQVDDAIAKYRSTPVPNIIIGKPDDGCPTIVAVSSQMKRIIAFAEEIAKSELNVLLTGETGTGKDLLARYIHHVSGRTGSLVIVNCAAIPSEMIEAELFGYKKGAFTGASSSKQGLFQIADGGTLYLNEVADASPEMQVKLLEALESKTIRRLGETTTRQANFRLIAATNLDLEKQIERGLFRRDLYHRLKQIRIDLPSLSERSNEIPSLVRHFLTESGVNIKPSDSDVVERLGAALSLTDYPGNVRELEARVSELAVSCKRDLSVMIESALADGFSSEADRLSTILDFTDWNRSKAAWILGVSESTVRHRIAKLGLCRD